MQLPLYARHHKKFKYVAGLNGLQLWRCGASKKV
jgi:hypothetical protein